MSDDVFDVTIVGAGPTGLFTAFYAGLRQMRTKIIEALPEPGGQLAVLYPEKFIYDVPGHPKILAKDLVRLLVQQVDLFDPEYAYEQRIDRLERVQHEGEAVWRLTTRDSAHYSRTVVITSGIGAFEPNRLDRPGIGEFEHRGVQYVVHDKRPLRGRRVLIVGGGDTAVDWALNLKDWASEVTLIHRRSEFRAHESSLAELRTSPVRVFTPYEIVRVEGNGRAERAVIASRDSEEEQTLEIDAVIVNIGFKASLGPMYEWGLELADNRHIRVNSSMETNLAGVFAAGDVASVDGVEPLSLIVTGFGQAAIAANNARRVVDPGARFFPGHSSDLVL
jgi:ferredoxin/flavodoxin---NADP+ reductase